MSESKRSVFTRGYFIPVAWDIKVRKVGEDLWELRYSETFDIKDKVLEKQAISDTKKIADMLAQMAGTPIPYTVGKNKFSLIFKGTLEQIATAISSEFIMASKFGDISLRDIFIMATVGTALKQYPTPRPPPPPPHFEATKAEEQSASGGV